MQWTITQARSPLQVARPGQTPPCFRDPCPRLLRRKQPRSCLYTSRSRLLAPAPPPGQGRHSLPCPQGRRTPAPRAKVRVAFSGGNTRQQRPSPSSGRALGYFPNHSEFKVVGWQGADVTQSGGLPQVVQVFPVTVVTLRCDGLILAICDGVTNDRHTLRGELSNVQIPTDVRPPPTQQRRSRRGPQAQSTKLELLRAVTPHAFSLQAP
ncbi:hypothetical protein Adeg_0747 [Ammonifex degensii KC4]|uniref:Uncharacterized protein n=1 Tax=Ammonifex degensii (strain DSM 10501 / KC4) TaxID=429009 RepID=C9RCB6_AMMDK|nr:hypothetical protein Adeg_0747 [Ammonifex degensii KC4]